MQWAYDFHIHTALSPCADEQMTPHNIVNMSLLKGLDIIAITDHQTVGNCKAVMEVGQSKGLVVLPGMEIECQEEFHWIALFKDLKSAYEMEKWLWQYLPPIENKPHIFGHQCYMNAKDEYVGELKQLLLVAAQISAYEILQKGRALGAFMYPAHVDRSSYSILSNLGSIPKEYHLTYLELSQSGSKKRYERQYPEYTWLQSSDAHYLEYIAERAYYIETQILKSQGLI